MKKIEDGTYEIDLLKLVKALWHKAFLICLISGLFASGGYAYSRFCITPMYKSDILVYVNNNSLSLGDSLSSITSSSLTASRSLVDTYIVILESRSTLNEIASKCGYFDVTAKDLSKAISTTTVNETEVFQITVKDKDPEKAARIANTIAKVLPEKIGDIVDGSSARIVDYAEVPTGKFYPQNVKNGIICGMVGFVLICAYVCIKELLDDAVKDVDDLTNYFEIPVLAVIPNLEHNSNSSSYDYYYSYKKKDKKD